jgi:hypothetical protein
MFAFKARSISEYIADPIAASTLIPANTVIFMADSNYMSTYASKSNWQFVSVPQSDGSPSYIRGTTNITNGAKLYTRTVPSSITTVTNGAHAGDPFYVTNRTGTLTQSGGTNTSAGAHTHSITGLNSASNLGGKYHYGAVVGLYKCVTPTYEIPKGALVFATTPQNEDLIQDGVYDGRSLISGNSSWVAARTQYGEEFYYGFSLSATISSSGSHNHSLTNARGNGSLAGSSYIGYNENGNLYGTHTHIYSITAYPDPAYKYQKTYRTVRNTGVYKGMILGWMGRSVSELPKGWYLCNGQVVNGYTTPTLNQDRCIACTNSDYYNGYEGGSDTVTINYSLSNSGTLQHTHLPDTGATISVYPNNGPGSYHSIYDWAHDHSGSYSSTWKQGYYTLNFIIYLG